MRQTGQAKGNIRKDGNAGAEMITAHTKIRRRIRARIMVVHKKGKAPDHVLYSHARRGAAGCDWVWSRGRRRYINML